MDSNRDRELEEELVNRALDLRAEATSTSLTGSASLTQAEGPEVTILYCVLAEVWIFERNTYFFLNFLYYLSFSLTLSPTLRHYVRTVV